MATGGDQVGAGATAGVGAGGLEVKLGPGSAGARPATVGILFSTGVQPKLEAGGFEFKEVVAISAAGGAQLVAGALPWSTGVSGQLVLGWGAAGIGAGDAGLNWLAAGSVGAGGAG